MIVSFDSQPASAVRERIAALPDLETFSLREQIAEVPLRSGSESVDNGVVEIVGRGRPGYAIVAGHGLTEKGNGVVLEQGLANDWGVGVGDTVRIDRSPPLRVAGLARAPDNVAYPLAAPHVYVSLASLRRAGVVRGERKVDLAQVWLRDPSSSTPSSSRRG